MEPPPEIVVISLILKAILYGNQNYTVESLRPDVLLLYHECGKGLEKIPCSKKCNGEPCSRDSLGVGRYFEDDRNEIADVVKNLGYTVSSTEEQQYETDEVLFTLIKNRGRIGMVLAIIVLLVDPMKIFRLEADIRGWFSFFAVAFILLWVGYPILVKTIMALRQRVFNANVLLSTAAWGSFMIGTLSLFHPVWPNFLPVGGWLMALHLFFGYFKLDTRKDAAEAVRKLLLLQPPKARVQWY